MWISSEDARSDFILASAAVFLGGQLAVLLFQVPGYPTAGIPYLVLGIVWLVALGCGAAYGLARYRNAIPAAFALDQTTRGTASAGIVVATPLVVAHVLSTLVTGDLGGTAWAFLGRFVRLSPTIGVSRFSTEGLLLGLALLIIAVGCWLTITFLAVRAHDAFQSPDTDLTELVRTWGMGGAGVVLLLGQLVALRDGGGAAGMLLLAVALGAVVLLADKYVPARVTVPRAAVLAPAITVVVLWIIVFGGPFRGDLLSGLFAGASAGVVTIAASTLVHARHGLAAGILLAASAIYPVAHGIIQPLPLDVMFP